MIFLKKALIGIACGLASSFIVGYCIHYDRKRRSDPAYKQKVRERREQERKLAASLELGQLAKEHHEKERYFVTQIQLGEALIGRGDYIKGIEHLGNALMVCGQPGRLLHLLESSLPPNVFQMLIFKMEEVGARLAVSNLNTKTTMPQENIRKLEPVIHDDVE